MHKIVLNELSYEMIIGLPPFYNRDQTPQQMFAAIAKKDVNFGNKVRLSAEAKDVIVQVLIFLLI